MYNIPSTHPHLRMQLKHKERIISLCIDKLRKLILPYDGVFYKGISALMPTSLSSFCLLWTLIWGQSLCNTQVYKKYMTKWNFQSYCWPWLWQDSPLAQVAMGDSENSCWMLFYIVALVIIHVSDNLEKPDRYQWIMQSI